MDQDVLADRVDVGDGILQLVAGDDATIKCWTKKRRQVEVQLRYASVDRDF